LLNALRLVREKVVAGDSEDELEGEQLNTSLEKIPSKIGWKFTLLKEEVNSGRFTSLSIGEKFILFSIANLMLLKTFAF
jgi:hypothetical protein